VCRIDGGDPTRVTREEADHEDDLQGLELDSDDFTGFYDDLRVTQGDIDVSGDVTAALTPESAELTSGGTTDLDIVVSNADTGVSAYSFTISVEDDSVATFTDFEYNEEPDFGNSEISDDGTSVTFEAAQGENTYDAAEEITVGSVVLEGGSRGETTITVSDARLVDSEQSVYEVTETDGASVSVTTPPPVVGETPPQDLNGDGLYRDINGDGTFDIFDVQVLYDRLESDAVQNNPGLYNFDQSENPEEVEIFDVQALFTDLQEQEDDETIAEQADIDREENESLTFSDVEATFTRQ